MPIGEFLDETKLPGADARMLRDGSFCIYANTGETINGQTLPVPCYLNSSDNEWYSCDGNDQTKLEFRGFAISNSTNANLIQIQTSGVVSGFTGLTVGSKYYVQDAVGTIGTTMGTYEVLVGRAISTTQILIEQGRDQYIGSDLNHQSGENVSIPALCDKIIANVTCVESSNLNPSGKGQLVIYKKGLTSASFTEVANLSVGKTVTITWNTGTGQVNITGDSGTADDIDLYFYKK